MICLFLVVNFLFVASHHLLVNLYGPQNVWLGPNSSILAETSSIFVKSIKVQELEYSTSGLQLDGFYRSPPLDVLVNWSTYQFLSISHDAYKGWPYHFNRGTHLNISYRVTLQGSAVQLLINQGVQGSSQSLYENAFRDTAWSWNLIQGSGMIELEISKSSSYYLTVANLNRKDVEVELNIVVRAVLYDTKQSFYNCTFSNGECAFNAMSLVGNSVVVTSPAPNQGVSVEDEWYIRFSYEPRWIAYVIFYGVVICFALVAMQFCKRLHCCGGRLTENDSVRRRLLAEKDDDSSCDEPFANDDADLEECKGNDGEASNRTKRLCSICFDAPRDCFFLPCGHCVTCYECGTTMAEADGSCPICGRKLKKVKRIFTVVGNILNHCLLIRKWDRNSELGWPYHFNRGTHLNISYRVKPQGSAVQLLINEGVQGSTQSLYEKAFGDTAWSWNLIQGSGMIELEISKSSSYYLTVANLNRKDVEVELNIDVRAVLYDTKQSFYNCTFSNGECTFNVMSLVGNSVVITSPAPSQGVSVEDEWYIRFSYEPRWIAYVILFGVVMGFGLVAMQFCNKLQCCGGVGHRTENDSARRRLLADKDDNDSCNEPFANDDDADLEESIGNDGEASNSSKRLCAICYDAQRDCFFLPCGHCVSCYQCGTKIARTDGSCPICRRRLKKVKRIYKA